MNMKITTVLLAACAIPVIASCASVEQRAPSGSAKASPLEPQVAEWIFQNAKPLRSIDMISHMADLQALDSVVKNASVVAFGEVYHGLHDHPKLRNRLAKYLVEKHGVKLIMVESGIFEGRLVDRYVLGDPTITLQDALNRGITHGMGPWEEMKELIEWMRIYNSKQNKFNNKVRFVGPDLAVVGDAPRIALEELKPFLHKVDPNLAQSLQTQIYPLAAKASAVTDQVAAALAEMYKKGQVASPDIDPDLLDGFGTISFDQMSAHEQSLLEKRLKGLIAVMQESKEAYAQATSRDEYEWNVHLPEVALQMVRNLRSRQEHPKIPHFETCIQYLKAGGLFDRLTIKNYAYPMDDISGHRIFFRNRESRERALADNVIWAQKVYGKAFIYSHNDHVFKEAINASVGEMEIGRVAKNEGQFLAEHFGDRYSMIFGASNRYVDDRGQDLPNFHGQPIDPLSECAGCMEQAFSQLPPAPAYLLTLGSASQEVQSLLSLERPFRDQLTFYSFHPRKSFDAILFVNEMRLGRKLK